MKEPLFERFTVKDIVFLAVISAVAICTSAVMPLVAHIYIFGLAQTVTALQNSLFPSIALFKIRKRGTVFFFTLLMGIIQLFMAPLMFFFQHTDRTFNRTHHLYNIQELQKR